MSTPIDRLIQIAASDRVTEATREKLHDLPAPVARYFQLALPQPAPHIRLATLSQIGSLRTDVRSSRWLSFEATHVAAPSAVGFVWNARVKVAPLLHVQVLDSLIAGRGSGQVRLLSALTIAADRDTREMNSGSLHRYLAEAVWYPTVLLPTAKLRWAPIDANKAVATLSERDVTVSLEFRFADSGEVTGVYTPERWGKFGSSYKQLPWEGHFTSYQRIDGMLVPSEGEVGWYFDEAWQAVWKGQVTTLSYEFSR
jgi:hypothetical protein